VVQPLVGTASHRCGRQPSVLQALQRCPLCCHATITWAPWPVMAAHESTQRLDAREVSQPPHGLNAIDRDVFNIIVDMFVSPNCARAAAIPPRGNQRLQQGHAKVQAIHKSRTTCSWRRDSQFVVTPRYYGLSRTLLGSEMHTFRCVTRYFVFVFCSVQVVLCLQTQELLVLLYLHVRFRLGFRFRQQRI
jgi:hypothetical protein